MDTMWLQNLIHLTNLQSRVTSYNRWIDFRRCSFCNEFINKNAKRKIAKHIEACDEQGTIQGIFDEKFGISQSQVSRWMVKRRDIMKDAAFKHRKLMKRVENQRHTLKIYKKL